MPGDVFFSHETGKAFLSDALIPISKLDRRRYSELQRAIELHAIGLVNYINFFNTLQDTRRRCRIQRLSDLPPSVQDSLDARSDWALSDSKSMAVAVHELVALFRSCGLVPVLEAHLPKLGKGVSHAKIELVLRGWSLMFGFTEAQFGHFWKKLARADLNILRALGGNG